MFLYLTVTVAAQEGPGIVIAHPGQDVELLCTLGLPSASQHTVAWLVNHVLRAVSPLRGGILPGYSANVLNNNLIVQNIIMSDSRNDTEHRCVIIISGTTTIVNNSDPTILYVAGKYWYYVCTL